jgi:hypothetical protein
MGVACVEEYFAGLGWSHTTGGCAVPIQFYDGFRWTTINV